MAFQTQQILEAIHVAVMDGGDGGMFLGKAYVSFYRGGKANKIDLREVGKLDAENIHIFFEMLTLRRRPNWRDEELYLAEKIIKAALREQTGDADWE